MVFLTYTQESLPLASIIINNYNYSHFLREAIDSALNQTYSNTEVIVVDDGSIDNSRDVIDSYGKQITPIFKENGGQASAFNAGIAAAKGHIIFFLDSDDTYHQNKVQSIVDIFEEQLRKEQYVMVYHLLECVKQNGVSTGNTLPNALYNFPSNMYHYVCKYKYLPYAAVPTSSIAINKELSQKIFPIPEQGVKTSADEFVVKPALLFGKIHGVNSILGKYRIHSENNWYGNSKIKTKEFLLIMQNFLNSKLEENGKKPIISFFDSIYAREYYMLYDSQKLFTLAFKVLFYHVDIITFKFFLKTVLTASSNIFLIKRKSGRS